MDMVNGNYQEGLNGYFAGLKQFPYQTRFHLRLAEYFVHFGYIKEAKEMYAAIQKHTPLYDVLPKLKKAIEDKEAAIQAGKIKKSP